MLLTITALLFILALNVNFHSVKEHRTMGSYFTYREIHGNIFEVPTREKIIDNRVAPFPFWFDECNFQFAALWSDVRLAIEEYKKKHRKDTEVQNKGTAIFSYGYWFKALSVLWDNETITAHDANSDSGTQYMVYWNSSYFKQRDTEE